jgi:hypothetical protein
MVDDLGAALVVLLLLPVLLLGTFLRETAVRLVLVAAAFLEAITLVATAAVPEPVLFFEEEEAIEGAMSTAKQRGIESHRRSHVDSILDDIVKICNCVRVFDDSNCNEPIEMDE